MRATLSSCLILGITATIPAQAEILTVCPDGSCDFTSIQTAIDEARSAKRTRILKGPRKTHPFRWRSPCSPASSPVSSACS